MAKKKAKPKNAEPTEDAGTPSASPWGALWFYSLVLALIAAFLGGFALFNRWGTEQLREDPRFQISFRDLQCDVPPGMTREEFLEEIQYLSRFPDKIFILAPQVKEQIRKAFQLHPWVLEVRDILESAKNSRSLKVRVVLREPVLAIPVEGTLRVVDGDGVLLPKSAPAKGLPVFEGDVPPPKNPAGKPWGDPNIEERAKKLKGNTGK